MMVFTLNQAQFDKLKADVKEQHGIDLPQPNNGVVHKFGCVITYGYTEPNLYVSVEQTMIPLTHHEAEAKIKEFVTPYTLEK